MKKSILFLKAKDRHDTGTGDMFGTHVETHTRKDGVTQTYHVSAPKPAAPKEHRYAMVNRPVGLGTTPDGVVRTEARPEKGAAHHDHARNGVAVFNRKLTDDETKRFEMAHMVDGNDMGEYADKVVAKFGRYGKQYLGMAEESPGDFEREVFDKLKSGVAGHVPSIGDRGTFVEMVKQRLKAAVPAPRAEEPKAAPLPEPAEPAEDHHPIAHMASALAPGKAKTLGDLAGQTGEGLSYLRDRDWQLGQETKDPAFAHAYRQHYTDGRIVQQKLSELDEKHAKLKIMSKIAGPEAMRLISDYARHPHYEPDERTLRNMIDDSKEHLNAARAKPLAKAILFTRKKP